MRALALAVVLIVFLAGCAEDDPAETEGERSPTPGASEMESKPSPTESKGEPHQGMGTRLKVGDSEFGPMLFDGRNQAIYLFDVETTAEPRCFGDCAEAWPPVLTDGAPAAGKGMRSGLLGTTSRTDGSRQVTYGGHPLYYYAHEGPGEVECHDVFLNGGNWYVVQPDGNRAP